jgi:RHS repeat-associated protein
MKLNQASLWIFLAVLFAATPIYNGLAIERDTPPSPVTPGLKFSLQPSAEEISKARIFEEPLVPIGGKPSDDENAALAEALLEYAKRTSPGDVSSLANFLERYPESPWRAALLTDLGLEYYNLAYYSRALDAWQEAWILGQKATDLRGKCVADRAVCELATLYSRLGRMAELEELLKSVSNRVFLGGTSERISLAREALWTMKKQPEISFRCGPLALQSIKRALDPNALLDDAVFNAASTQQGCSLAQVAELSKQIGQNYQMAFREKAGELVIPSMVHWKVGHYAALVRQVGDRYLLEDPTFGNSVWATKEALDLETSGYFLIPPGNLPHGWRRVTESQGKNIWGKGLISGIDPDNYTPKDLQTGTCPTREEDQMGMAISRVHLGLANLQVRDTPVGYTPPIGPRVRFTVRYNHRDYLQPASAISTSFGPKWTHDWYAYIRDNSSSPLADVRYIVGGGGARTFTGYDTNTQTFAPQQMEETRLRRIGGSVATSSYEMTLPDGSRKVFGLRAANRALLTQVIDPVGNAVTLGYSGDFLTSITDAIGQTTTITWQHTTNADLITKVTDPFGRFATFDYVTYNIQGLNPQNPNTPTPISVLANITDTLGLVSHFSYSLDTNLVMQQMVTPYGTTSFSATPASQADGSTRFVQIQYPDGSRERVEFNQSTNPGVAFSEPGGRVPTGMGAANQYLWFRNTFYWDRNACAQGYGDYSKARIYHWLHTPNIATMAGILESTKAPLEGRVWYDYTGQSSPLIVGDSDKPKHVGRVLDDGSTQLFTYARNSFGHVTNSVDPVGRTFSYLYATNGVDLLQVRQTRGTNNQLLSSMTYNSQHLPLTMTDASGQTITNTYNARGQRLTTTNPKGETTTFTYNPDDYLTAINGPLPGNDDTVTIGYDSHGRPNSVTNESGYVERFTYDAMDRITRITYPDATYTENTYDRLDLSSTRDRAGRTTSFAYNNVQEMTRRTDPLGRVTYFDWCGCGSLKSLTDPMGRTTTWLMDVQGRQAGKMYPDGSQVHLDYESSTSRLRQVTDEVLQTTTFTYNRDDTFRTVAYGNTQVPTPAVSFTYDPDFERTASVTDGSGTRTYVYNQITTNLPALGAGKLASKNGPFVQDTITYAYDELGRLTNRTINGISQTWSRDPLGRVTNNANALGTFTYAYDGASLRLKDVIGPTGLSSHFDYFGDIGDFRLQQITHRKADTSLLSQFTLAYDVNGNPTNWAQQLGSFNETWAATYDPGDRLSSALANQGGTNLVSTLYTYDAMDSRLVENVAGVPRQSHFNALNQLVSSGLQPTNTTYEWDGTYRLAAVTRGTNRSEFGYDWQGRLHRITEKQGGLAVSERRFTWCGTQLCAERDTNGSNVVLFFPGGEQRASGSYYYLRDHLGSVRELVDGTSAVRAEYSYSPYGNRLRRQGDLDTDMGYAQLFSHQASGLMFALGRVYDPRQARWLSRDPIGESGGMNLYSYANQNPLRWVDPLGYESKEEKAAANIAGIAGTAYDASEEIAKLGIKNLENVPWILRNADYWSEVEQVSHFAKFAKFAKIGGIAFDVVEVGFSLKAAWDCPDAEHFLSLGWNVGTIALMWACPPMGLAIKTAEILNDVTGGSMDMERILNIANPRAAELSDTPMSTD